MENEKILSYVLEHYGISGFIAVVYVWEKLIYPQWKKSKGTYVSYSSLKSDIEMLKNGLAGQKDEFSKHKQEYHEHMKTEEKEEARFAVLENNDIHLKETTEDIKDVLKEMRATQQEAFNLISEIRRYQIERKP